MCRKAVNQSIVLTGTWPLANIDWFYSFCTCVSIEDFTNSFYKVIYDCIDENKPHPTSKGSRRNNKQLYPLSVRKLETKKSQAWRLHWLSVVNHTLLNIN